MCIFKEKQNQDIFRLNSTIVTERQHYSFLLTRAVFVVTDDRIPPPALAPPPAPAPFLLPMDRPPKRPDKSTKPKLPPRPLSKVFSSYEHGSNVLQVHSSNCTSCPRHLGVDVTALYAAINTMKETDNNVGYLWEKHAVWIYCSLQRASILSEEMRLCVTSSWFLETAQKHSRFTESSWLHAVIILKQCSQVCSTFYDIWRQAI